MALTITERLTGDARVLAGAGYALLLQVAHPVVGAGVEQHSNFQQDPWGRLIRTLDYVNVSVFGAPAAAEMMGRRTRAMHKRIKGVLPDGTRYHSLEPGAFAWVHATLAESILRSHELFGAPPTQRERQAFYGDWRRLGEYVGVRDRDLPPTYRGFVDYVRQMESDVLEDTTSVRTVLRSLTRPAAPDVPLLTDGAWKVARMPAVHTVRLATLGLLRPGLRERLGLKWTRGDALGLAAVTRASRAAGPVLPAAARDFGRAYLRWRHDALVAQGLPMDGTAATLPLAA